MKYLLDTMAVSALRVPRRNPSMMRWISDKPASDLVISTFTIGELRQGLTNQTDQTAKEAIGNWLEDLLETFSDRILPYGVKESLTWGDMIVPMTLKGDLPGAVDSLIAAVAVTHDLSIVTRNVKHFNRFQVPVINPWDDENGA
ncbi:MAG: type II toxin-antitoxin system VapC family toxin [bacterium]